VKEKKVAIEGLTTIRSTHGAKETMDRLEAAVRAKGITVFARIDHAAGAVAAGLALRPTEVLIFGAAKAGTPLMAAAQTIGIDLPLKVLVYEDEAGVTWLATNQPAWLQRRHGVAPALDANVAAMAEGLERLVMAAGQP
jgi:uncharacterized protein (DUF302 family)